VFWHDDCDPGGRVARVQPHASRGDGGDPEGVGPKGAPQSVSEEFPRAEEAPTKTRRYHQGIPCLDRQTTQESHTQCSDTLTGLADRLGVGVPDALWAVAIGACCSAPHDTQAADAPGQVLQKASALSGPHPSTLLC